jgi:hypothetical protein
LGGRYRRLRLAQRVDPLQAPRAAELWTHLAAQHPEGVQKHGVTDDVFLTDFLGADPPGHHRVPHRDHVQRIEEGAHLRGK